MTSFLFENAAILDGQSRELRLDQHVLVEDNRIVEVSDKPIRSKTSQNVTEFLNDMCKQFFARILIEFVSI